MNKYNNNMLFIDKIYISTGEVLQRKTAFMIDNFLIVTDADQEEDKQDEQGSSSYSWININYIIMLSGVQIKEKINNLMKISFL